MTLAGYAERLAAAGALDVDSVDVDDAKRIMLHRDRVAATLGLQWEAVGDRTAQELLQVAAALPEAEAIPVARLSLLSGLAPKVEPGFPSPLREALKVLFRWSLVEELSGDALRLHPLVREFAQRKTAGREAFGEGCAGRLGEAPDPQSVLRDGY